MSTPTPTTPPTPAQQVKTLQIIAAALIAGVTMFLILTIVLRGSSGPLFDPKRPLTDPMTLIGLVFGFSVLVVSRVVPDLAATAAVRQISPSAPEEMRQGGLMQAFTSRTIIGLALIEGGAFFNLVLFLINGAWPNLALGALLLLALVPGIPSLDRLEGWIERQTENLR
jgi:hypothetical protein